MSDIFCIIVSEKCLNFFLELKDITILDLQKNSSNVFLKSDLGFGPTLIFQYLPTLSSFICLSRVFIVVETRGYRKFNTMQINNNV